MDNRRNPNDNDSKNINQSLAENFNEQKQPSNQGILREQKQQKNTVEINNFINDAINSKTIPRYNKVKYLSSNAYALLFSELIISPEFDKINFNESDTPAEEVTLEIFLDDVEVRTLQKLTQALAADKLKNDLTIIFSAKNYREVITDQEIKSEIEYKNHEAVHQAVCDLLNKGVAQASQTKFLIEFKNYYLHSYTIAALAQVIASPNSGNQLQILIHDTEEEIDEDNEEETPEYFIQNPIEYTRFEALIPALQIRANHPHRLENVFLTLEINTLSYNMKSFIMSLSAVIEQSRHDFSKPLPDNFHLTLKNYADAANADHAIIQNLLPSLKNNNTPRNFTIHLGGDVVNSVSGYLDEELPEFHPIGTIHSADMQRKLTMFENSLSGSVETSLFSFPYGFAFNTDSVGDEIDGSFNLQNRYIDKVRDNYRSAIRKLIADEIKLEMPKDLTNIVIDYATEGTEQIELQNQKIINILSLKEESTSFTFADRFELAKQMLNEFQEIKPENMNNSQKEQLLQLFNIVQSYLSAQINDSIKKEDIDSALQLLNMFINFSETNFQFFNFIDKNRVGYHKIYISQFSLLCKVYDRLASDTKSQTNSNLQIDCYLKFLAACSKVSDEVKIIFAEEITDKINSVARFLNDRAITNYKNNAPRAMVHQDYQQAIFLMSNTAPALIKNPNFQINILILADLHRLYGQLLLSEKYYSDAIQHFRTAMQIYEVQPLVEKPFANNVAELTFLQNVLIFFIEADKKHYQATNNILNPQNISTQESKPSNESLSQMRESFEKNSSLLNSELKSKPGVNKEIQAWLETFYKLSDTFIKLQSDLAAYPMDDKDKKLFPKMLNLFKAITSEIYSVIDKLQKSLENNSSVIYATNQIKQILKTLPDKLEEQLKSSPESKFSP